MAGYEVGSAYLTVMPSAKDFTKNLSRQVDGPFSAAGRRGGATMGQGVEKGGKKGFLAAGGSLGKVFIGAFAAIGAANIIGEVINFASDAIDSASKLEQSVGGVDAVFKESADTIHKWADEAADAVGLSQNEFNELATVIGAQLKNMGLPLDEVTEQTGSLVEMGADLAAQFGGSTSDAVAALSSLLRGERDPIERYGVSINEARIKAKLAEDGLEGLEGKALDNAKAQATLALLTEQTADAHGAFARESDTLAGKQQRLTAKMDDLKAEIGTALMPVMSDMVGIFASDVLPIVEEFSAWLVENQDEIRDFSLFMLDMGLASLEASLQIAKGFAMWFDVGITVIDTITRAMLGFVDGMLTAAAKAFGWIPGIGPKLEEASEEFKGFRDDAVDKLDAARDSADKITNALDDAAGAVGGLRQSVKNLNGARATVYVDAKGTATRALQDGSFRRDGSTLSFRAAGGPVTSGQPYVVGEYEPELFVPDRSGVIYNQKQLAAMAGQGGGPTVEQNNYITNPDPDAVLGVISARLGSAMAGAR